MGCPMSGADTSKRFEGVREPVRFKYPTCYKQHQYENIPVCWTCDIHKMCKREER